MRRLRTGNTIEPVVRQFYQRSIDVLNDANVPFLVGGAYAIELYTGHIRKTKDFDVFVMKDDVEKALEAFRQAGFESEFTFPHWLGKVYQGDKFVDVIFSSGNGVAPVDEVWFENARKAILFGRVVPVSPPEESLWSKAFIMERERYDGADVAHLLYATAEELDWHRLIQRFGPHWRVLYAHLTLFGYIYPGRRDTIPAWVMRALTDRISSEINDDPLPVDVCRGTVLSRAQYLGDVEKHELIDGRLVPFGVMTPEEVEAWTEAIGKEK